MYDTNNDELAEKITKEAEEKELPWFAGMFNPMIFCKDNKNDTFNEKEKKRYVWYEDLDGVICCPNCCTRIDDLFHEVCGEEESVEPDYCPYCGQHLDWTENRMYGTNEWH